MSQLALAEARCELRKELTLHHYDKDEVVRIVESNRE